MLDKAIQSGKEHRKEYRRSKKFDKSCRNHGGCPWCLSNRLHSNRKREEEARCRLIESDLLYNVEIETYLQQVKRQYNKSYVYYLQDFYVEFYITTRKYVA